MRGFFDKDLKPTDRINAKYYIRPFLFSLNSIHNKVPRLEIGAIVFVCYHDSRKSNSGVSAPSFSLTIKHIK